MAWAVEFILDDRSPPPPEVETIVGRTRFSDMLRRRARHHKTLRAEATKGGCNAFHHLLIDEDAEALTTRIENAPQKSVCYLRMPGCLAPMEMSRLSELADKARFAMSTTLIGAVFRNEATALLTRDDALAVLHAPDDAARRALFLGLADTAETMFDHLEVIDLRSARNFLRFITGSTEARHFNQLDSTDGVLTKSSTDIAKMRAEYAFFHAVPEEMKRFLVPTFGFVEDGHKACYSMEHLVVPDVALQAVHHALSPPNYETLIGQFFAFWQARATRKIGKAAVRDVGADQILGKMTRRLADLRRMREGQRIDCLLSAARPGGGLDDMEARANALINHALDLDPSDSLAVSHGDPCFSNMLFDRRTALFRLIDPRGSETAEGAEMHPLYDLAKFSHSVLGNYDFVNSDLFTCTVDEGLDIAFSLEGGGTPEAAREVFRQRVADAGINLWIMRAYELSLFLSMLPLHRDHPRKLLGFAMIASGLIDELEGTRPKSGLF